MCQGWGSAPTRSCQCPAGPIPGTAWDQQEPWEHSRDTTRQIPLALPGSGHARKGVDTQCLHLPPPQRLGWCPLGTTGPGAGDPVLHSPGSKPCPYCDSGCPLTPRQAEDVRTHFPWPPELEVPRGWAGMQCQP